MLPGSLFRLPNLLHPMQHGVSNNSTPQMVVGGNEVGDNSKVGTTDATTALLLAPQLMPSQQWRQLAQQLSKGRTNWGWLSTSSSRVVVGWRPLGNLKE